MHHLTDSELELYRKRDMPPERLLVANSHLFSCEQCYVRYGAGDKVESAFAILHDLQTTNEDEPGHLSFEQLADYVDDNLNEKSRAEVHLHIQQCTECNIRLDELAALKPLVIVLPQAKHPTLQERFFAFLQPRWALQLTSLLLIAALLLWAIALRKQVNGLEQEVSKLETANELLAQNPVKTGESPNVDDSQALSDVQDKPENFLTLSDANGQITIDEKGNLKGFSDLSPVYEKSIKEALTKGRLQLPRMPSGAGKTDVFMGTNEEESFALISPVGKVLQSVRPSFRWKPVKDVTSYQVLLKDSAGNLIDSGELKVPEWTINVPLKRGALYSWQVVAVKNGREIIAPSPTQAAAQVKILEQAEVDELAQVKRTHPDSHLLLGILYAKAGLLDEATQELTILLKSNPRADVVKKLLNLLKVRSS